MTQPESLKISVDSLMNETKRISQFLISKHTSLIFFHNMLQADIDYESYCSLYDSIKKYAGTIPLNADTKIIKEKIAPLIKGGGGGQKTLATAGGQDASNLPQVIEKVKELLQ